jgi:hypothetical protein
VSVRIKTDKRHNVLLSVMETTESQQICCTFNFKLVARSGLLSEFKTVEVYELRHREKLVC